LLAGCGSPAPRATEPAPVSLGTPEESAQELEEPGVIEAGDRRADRDDGSLAACVTRMRDDPDLPSSAEATGAYAAALAIERRGDLPGARRAYYDLILRSPQSPYMPLVYLAFAELFAADAATDPSKWELAKQAYREVTKYPPPGNPAHAYSLLRLGEIEQVQGEFQQALASFVKVAQAIRTRPEPACSAELEAPTRTRAVKAFAQVGAPKKAVSLFRRTAGDQADVWLAELADEYIALGKRGDACAALRASGSALESARRRACR
jgi:tetratricopeptide (TPR) repeat protein